VATAKSTPFCTPSRSEGRDSGAGRIYYQRKIAQGKTPTEARRALKRRLAKVIYR
jgi:transposase